MSALAAAESQGGTGSAGDDAAFYSWLDRYGDPKAEPARVRPQPLSPAESSPGAGEAWYAWGRETLESLASWARPFWAVAPPQAKDGERLVEATAEGGGESSEPSLGCFYHRDYYTHLPMFQGENFELPGSYEASEVYRKEFAGAFPPTGKRAPGAGGADEVANPDR